MEPPTNIIAHTYAYASECTAAPVSFVNQMAQKQGVQYFLARAVLLALMHHIQSLHKRRYHFE